MTKKDLIKKILELGKELEKANGFDAIMIINDMEIEVDNYTKQLPIHIVRKSFTAEEVVNELEDCDTLDDAIMFFKEQIMTIESTEHQESTNPPLIIASVDDMLRFINSIRQTDQYIEMIYMNGACYQFHLMLKKFAPECEPYISKEKDHVITKYAGRYYDITGEVSGNWYTPMTESEIDMASGWSFHRTKVIQIGECPHCGEPIVV